MINKNPFKYFKASPEIIKLAVWMYVRYPLSLRQVEDILHERGINITHETVRYWWNRFGPLLAKEVRKRRATSYSYSRWTWHLDEAFVKINGETYYLWRAIDHEGEVLESYVSKHRNKCSALKILRKLMKRYGSCDRLVTDKLKSYSAALRDIVCSEKHETSQYKNNRIENSHPHFRRRERAMYRFRSMKTLQKFSSIHASISNNFYHHRHLETRSNYKAFRNQSVSDWNHLLTA